LVSATTLKSGQPFTTFIDQYQLQKVGMKRTSEGGFAHYDAIVPHTARGYSSINTDKLKNAYEYFPPFLRTAAGMSSTATELAQWVIALQNGELLTKPSSSPYWWRSLSLVCLPRR
jgi:CubicO group peptidase (beta-lactamase class C family)